SAGGGTGPARGHAHSRRPAKGLGRGSAACIRAKGSQVTAADPLPILATELRVWLRLAAFQSNNFVTSLEIFVALFIAPFGIAKYKFQGRPWRFSSRYSARFGLRPMRLAQRNLNSLRWRLPELFDFRQVAQVP